MRKVFIAERALRTFLGGLRHKINPDHYQHEGYRTGNGTLDILIHNKSFQENVSSTGLKNKLNSGEAQKIWLFFLG
ncbi:MAG: hypothetical protein MK236_02835 [Pedosphaera sp.]|nr:hypothetical protein [Pedosphaera sp.]